MTSAFAAATVAVRGGSGRVVVEAMVGARVGAAVAAVVGRTTFVGVGAVVGVAVGAFIAWATSPGTCAIAAQNANARITTIVTTKIASEPFGSFGHHLSASHSPGLIKKSVFFISSPP